MEHFFFATMIFLLCIVSSECEQGLYPNVSLQDLTETPEFTQPNVLFVYKWSVEEQALCPGTVTALEYCYQMSISIDQENRIIFTLLLLDSSYGIVQTINVTNTTTLDNCSNRGGVMTCCNRQQLMAEEQFQVPGSSVTGFGIFSETGKDTILAYREFTMNVTGFELAANAVIVNNQISVSPNQETIIQYRMFNFAIGKDMTPTGEIDLHSVPELTTSTESRTEISDNTTISDPTTREGPLSTILIIEITIGCTMVPLIIGAIAMCTYLCLKTRAKQSLQQSNTESLMAERNTQLVYKLIPKGMNGPTAVPPNHMTESVQHAINEQQGQEISTPLNSPNQSESEFAYNPVYLNSSISLHDGGTESIAQLNIREDPNATETN